jgi:hypothetical protein
MKEFHVPGVTVGIRHENETFIERARSLPLTF